MTPNLRSKHHHFIPSHDLMGQESRQGSAGWFFAPGSRSGSHLGRTELPNGLNVQGGFTPYPVNY
jgi:hypothetical protein